MNTQISDQVQRSKYLSMLLRHRPERANLTLDKEGWCSIESLVKNTDFTHPELLVIADEDNKMRYQISTDGLSIRACQGHTVSSVQMTFKRVIPPAILYHGADSRFIEPIRKRGLVPVKRHHVHLSATKEVADVVGRRRRSGYILLEIDAAKFIADGHRMFISENGVYLCDHVPPQYFKEIE